MFKFTVCIPTYNRAHTIQSTLNSLVKQTYGDFEVLVIDDGSIDNTQDVVSQFYSKLNIRYVKKNNGGKHTALNKGIELANGELFIILDSDDMLVSTCLEQMSIIWNSYDDKTGICGIMGKSMANDKLIGRPFPNNIKLMSYVEYHFGKYAGWFNDCCECLRTDILKQFYWPENIETKFIPENYVMDQIGLKYKLILTNDIFQNKDYLNDGITNNIDNHIIKNINGYLFNAISKIEIILPNANKNELSPTAPQNMWYNYWKLHYLKKGDNNLHVSKISMLGYYMYWRFHITRIVKGILKIK